MTTPATPTVARTKPQGGGHWYDLSGNPQYEIPKKDGSGMRSTTLADARKLNLVPSVTTILKILHKEQLVRWMIEQAVLAVLTAPRKEGEPQDAFVKRVLQEEQQQDQEAAIARDRGKDIHDALELYFSGEAVPEPMEVYVRPVIDRLLAFGERASSEVILVGDDYAGMTDLIQDCTDALIWRMWDFKSTKSLPDPNKGGAWGEHRLQLSAYAKAFQNKLKRGGGEIKPIICGNIYISTITPGEFVICEHEDWEGTYEQGFAPLVRHWQWVNRYRPENPKRIADEAKAETLQEIFSLRHQLEESNRLLREAREMLERPAPTVAAPQAAPAPVSISSTSNEEAKAETLRAQRKALPSVIGGKKVTWTTGTVAPSNNQPPTQ